MKGTPGSHEMGIHETCELSHCTVGSSYRVRAYGMPL